MAYRGLYHLWEAVEFSKPSSLTTRRIQHTIWITKVGEQKELVHLIQSMVESIYKLLPYFRFQKLQVVPCSRWQQNSVKRHSYPYDEGYHRSQSMGMICLNHKALELVQQKIEQTRISCCFLDNVKIQMSSGFHWMLCSQLQSLRISTIQLSYNRGMKAWWIICSSKL